MKAVFIEKFGGRDVLAFGDLPTPRVEADEMLVQVAYAGTNPVDYKIREGLLEKAMPHAFPLVPGWDVAGEVIEVGSAVKDFVPGDRIFAYTRKDSVQAGTYAEYIAVTENMAARAPRNIDLAQAASIPLAALTAWQALHELLLVEKGQTILVHAGAGGVGSFAIQMAKLAGCHVITTASQEKHAYVKGLGADEAIDYRTINWVEHIRQAHPSGVDAVFDTVGGDTLTQSYQLLKDNGALVSIVEAPLPSPNHSERNIRASYLFVRPQAQQLASIAQLIEQGDLKVPTIDVLPITDAAKAHDRLESRRVTGKIVLQVH